MTGEKSKQDSGNDKNDDIKYEKQLDKNKLEMYNLQ